MHIFSAVLYAVSANIDALSIGIAYGIKKTHINHQKNFMIAFITMIGTYGAMRFGHFLTNYISLSLADFLGSSLLPVSYTHLIIIGTVFLRKSRWKYFNGRWT